METQKLILEEIDDAIALYDAAKRKSKFDDLSDLLESESTELIGSAASTIERNAPCGSSHRRVLSSMLESWRPGYGWQLVESVLGILKALRRDYERGFLKTVEELVHADTFSGLIEMAEHLQESGYKDAAAVITGSVLEQHLRALGAKCGIDVAVGEKFKMAETLNAELAAASVYSKLDQKSVTSWLGLRNNAAHGNYDIYTQQQVKLLIDSVRDFLTRNSA